MLLLPCFELCPVLRVQGFLCTANNAENLLLFQEYIYFQTPALVSVPSNVLIVIAVDSAILSFAPASGLSVLLRDRVDDAVNPSRVGQISEVPGLITCCTVSGVLNLSIDPNSLTR